MKAGGAVMKAAKGGFLKDSSPGKSYAGFPHSPTSKVDDAVSAHKDGGSAGRSMAGRDVEGQGKGLTPPGKKLNTGSSRTYGDDDTGVPGPLHSKKKVKKLQFGGGAGGGMGQMGLGGGSQSPATPPGGAGLMGVFPGRQPVPEQQGPPNVSGRPMMPAQPLTVPQPKMGSSVFQRPAPGTTVGFKKGGNVHEDEAEDRKLFKSMIKKRAGGGFVPKQATSKDPGLVSSKYHQQGKGYASGGNVTGGAGAGSGTGISRLARSK